MNDNNIVTPPEWGKWELELVERLHTAVYAAEQICMCDKRRVDEMKAQLKARIRNAQQEIREGIRNAQQEIREAERIARKSKTQFDNLYSQVWKLAKRHNVTSISYDLQNRTSRASIG